MGNVVSRIWVDRKFNTLNDSQKLLFIYLCTCPESTSLPGLYHHAIPAMAVGVRNSVEATAQNLQALITARIVEYDADVLLLRIPNAPRYAPTGNTNVIRGWFRKWSAIEDSDLKTRHIESIEAVVSHLIDEARSEKDERKAKNWTDTWNETFAKPKRSAKVERQIPLFVTSVIPHTSSDGHQMVIRPSSDEPSDITRNSDQRSETEIRNRDPESGIRDPDSSGGHEVGGDLKNREGVDADSWETDDAADDLEVPRKRMSTKSEPLDASDYRRVTDYWQLRFLEYTGKKPDWEDGKMHKLLRPLVKRHGADEVISRMRNLFDAPPKFLAEDVPTIDTLSHFFEKFALPNDGCRPPRGIRPNGAMTIAEMDAFTAEARRRGV